MKLGEDFGKALGSSGKALGKLWELLGRRPTARLTAYIYKLPINQLCWPDILRELALAYIRKYRMSCVHVRVGSFGAITRVCEMG